MELNSLEMQLNAKRKKFEEMETNHADVRAKLEAKYKEFRDIEDKIKKLNVYTLEYKNCNIIVRKNDLTLELSEAIVNPANEKLMHEGGAARAIVDKGGDIIWEESKQYIKKNGNLLTGQAMVTSAGKLPCKYVIHAVGPKYNKNLPDNSQANDQLKMVTNSILNIIKKENIDSVSIPAISTGIFSFPRSKAAIIIGITVRRFIDSNSNEMRGKSVVFCNFDDSTTDVFSKIIPNCFSPKVQEDNSEEMKQVENERENKTNSILICKKCNKKITEKKHKTKGKDLKICYKCYKKRKMCKEEETDESDDNKVINRKKIKKKYNNTKDESEEESDEVDTNKIRKKMDDSDDDEEEDDFLEAKNDKNKKIKNKSSEERSDSKNSVDDNESQDEFKK